MGDIWDDWKVVADKMGYSDHFQLGYEDNWDCFPYDSECRDREEYDKGWDSAQFDIEHNIPHILFWSK